MSRNSNKHVIVTPSIINSSLACTVCDSKKEQDIELAGVYVTIVTFPHYDTVTTTV